jgi:TetR/AcrR family transcriptional regulator, ethionamide resistance regulator
MAGRRSILDTVVVVARSGPPRQHVRSRTAASRTATMQLILDATEALLEDKPIREIGVEDVMARTGLGRTAFYRYFPDLESVLLRHMERIAGDLHAASDTWLASSDPNAVLGDVARRMVHVFADNGRLIQAFSHSAGGGEDVESAWASVIDSFVVPAVARVEQLIETGRADVDHPAQAVRALVVLIDSYLTDAYGVSRDAVPVDVAAEVLTAIWRRSLRLRSPG